MVAAVDVGILNLTNYKPPAPDDYYLGQRRLTAEIRDLYGQLIDGMQGTRGQIKTGGDAGAELQGSAADAKAAGALFRHRHGRRRRHRGGQFRHSGFRRHRARDGGGVDRDQARPRHHRRHRARSRGADGDPAALPAQWRPRHHEHGPRQCRGRGRRLRHQRQDDGPGEGDRQSRHHAEARRQAAHLDVARRSMPAAPAPRISTSTSRGRTG